MSSFDSSSASHAASRTRKKVIVRKLSRDWFAGYLPSAGFVEQGRIDVLDLAGKVTSVELEGVKWVCFVRDFSSGEANNPERLLRKTFAGRPRTEGLWLRLKLKDNDELEGIASNDLSLIESDGAFLVPQDTRSNTQRIFIPRTSIEELEVVAVIGSAAKRIAKKAAPGTRLQTGLFEE
jgi:hypothetical protein